MSEGQNINKQMTDGSVTAMSPTIKSAQRVNSSFDITTMDTSAATSTSERSLISHSTKTSNRYIVSLLTLFTINFILIIAMRMALLDSILSRMSASLIIPVMAFFTYEWSFIHSSGLTRKSRAFWNESNILLTYQPRARFEGHKFKPDPPTPGPNMPALLEGGCMGGSNDFHESEDKSTKDQREAFEASRSAHYANEFALALKGQAATTTSDSLRVDVQIAGSPIDGLDDGLRPVSLEDIPKATKSLNALEISEADKLDIKAPEKKEQTSTKNPHYKALDDLKNDELFEKKGNNNMMPGNDDRAKPLNKQQKNE